MSNFGLFTSRCWVLRFNSMMSWYVLYDHFEIHNCWRGRLKSTPYVELLECVVGRVVSRTLKIFFSKWSCQCVELKISQWDVSMHMSSMFLSGMELYINFSSILRQNSASAFGYFVPSILFFFENMISGIFRYFPPKKWGEPFPHTPFPSTQTTQTTSGGSLHATQGLDQLQGFRFLRRSRRWGTLKIPTHDGSHKIP